MLKRLIGVAAGCLLLVTVASPVGAITNGVPDESEHPYVGQLFFYVPDDVDPRFSDPGVWYRCSGTLVSPTVVLTAGHCSYDVGLDGESTIPAGGSGGDDVWVNFDEAPSYDGLPPSANYVPDRNQQRYLDRVDWLATQPAWHRGTSYHHPLYDNDLFWLHDAGVVVLDEPVDLPTYGTLPHLNELASFAHLRPHSAARFTDVGYGTEKALPKSQFGGDTRRKADVALITLRGTFGVPYGVSAVFTNDKGAVHQGGTCYGDSGGPILEKGTNVIVAVTSFGESPNCTGADGTYRIDQPDDLEWIADAFGITS